MQKHIPGVGPSSHAMAAITRPDIIEEHRGKIHIDIFDSKDLMGRLIARNVQIGGAGIPETVEGLTLIHAVLLQAASEVSNALVGLAMHQAQNPNNVVIARPAG